VLGDGIQGHFSWFGITGALLPEASICIGDAFRAVIGLERGLLKYVCFQKSRCFTGGRFGGELVTYDSADAVNWNTGKLASKPYVERLELLFATGDRVCGII